MRSLGRLLAGLLVVFANHVYADDPRPKGTWQIIDADFSDIGHCLMTQTLEITLKLGERRDGKDGTYIESFSREGDSGGCPSLGFYRILYDVKLTPALRSKSEYVATLTFNDCQQRGGQTCGIVEPVSYKRLVLDKSRNGAVFDGIFLDRIE